MNIGMVLNQSFPPDIRVEKEAKALVEAGHRVFIISLHKANSLDEEIIDGYTVLRKKMPNSRLRFAFLNFNFIDSYMRSFVKDVISEYEIDVLHVHDLPMVKTAIVASEAMNIPVIADLHENYPEGLREWRKRSPFSKLIRQLIAPIGKWKRYEKEILQKVAKVITVDECVIEHYVKDCNVPSKDIIVIMNVADLDNFKPELYSPRQNDGKYVISYVGTLGPHRGIDTLLYSAKMLISEIPNLELKIIGGRPEQKYFSYLKKLSRRLGLEKNVDFTGWISFKEAMQYIFHSDVCVIPHKRSIHTESGFPHKLTQYMAFGKPVVVSDCRPMKLIVENSECGLVFESENSDDLAEKILQIHNQPEVAVEMGANGVKAVKDKYNWQIEAQKLAKLYDTF